MDNFADLPLVEKKKWRYDSTDNLCIRDEKAGFL